MSDFLIPAAMAALGVLTAWAICKAWAAPGQRPPASQTEVALSAPHEPPIVDSSHREMPRPASPSHSPAPPLPRLLSPSWTRGAPRVAVAMVAFVAAGSDLTAWLQSPAETPARAGTRTVVIAWSLALVASVVLSMPSIRRSAPEETSDSV
ncbi:MAG: hypothetical protein IT428_01990 [Planctomycetaceae bacterium]|nr:hypothetical protein [Planctomycetaceae bacterium]